MTRTKQQLCRFSESRIARQSRDIRSQRLFWKERCRPRGNCLNVGAGTRQQGWPAVASSLICISSASLHFSLSPWHFQHHPPPVSSEDTLNGITNVCSCRNESPLGTPKRESAAPDLLRAAWTFMASDSCEFSLVPTAFTALTRKMYCSPGVRPCTTNLGGQGWRVARLHPRPPAAAGQSL